MAVYHGKSLGKCLMDEGLVPKNARHVELHIAADEAVFVRYDVLFEDADAPKWARALTKLLEPRSEPEADGL